MTSSACTPSEQKCGCHQRMPNNIEHPLMASSLSLLRHDNRGWRRSTARSPRSKQRDEQTQRHWRKQPVCRQLHHALVASDIIHKRADPWESAGGKKVIGSVKKQRGRRVEEREQKRCTQKRCHHRYSTTLHPLFDATTAPRHPKNTHAV